MTEWVHVGGSDEKREGRWVWTDGSSVHTKDACKSVIMGRFDNAHGGQDYMIFRYDGLCDDIQDRARPFICGIDESMYYIEILLEIFAMDGVIWQAFSFNLSNI